MRGLRYLLRELTASAVREHLRSQLESAPAPVLTPRETELIGFVRERATQLAALEAEGAVAVED